jgi:WD40 repeat protein
MDNVILLWDINRQVPPNRLTGHKVIFFAYFQNQIHDLKFSPNGNLLVSASSDESLKFWEVDFDSKAK